MSTDIRGCNRTSWAHEVPSDKVGTFGRPDAPSSQACGRRDRNSRQRGLRSPCRDANGTQRSKPQKQATPNLFAQVECSTLRNQRVRLRGSGGFEGQSSPLLASGALLLE